jgi:hypothetical protein
VPRPYRTEMADEIVEQVVWALAGILGIVSYLGMRSLSSLCEICVQHVKEMALPFHRLRLPPLPENHPHHRRRHQGARKEPKTPAPQHGRQGYLQGEVAHHLPTSLASKSLGLAEAGRHLLWVTPFWPAALSPVWEKGKVVSVATQAWWRHLVT